MALGDILSVTVRADGWSADVVVEGFTTGATYDFGLGTNNANLAGAKVVFTVVSEGYNSAGTLGTVTRTVYGTSVVRKPYPNEAQKDETGGGNLTVRIALSDPIYDDDNTGAGKSGTAPTVSFSAGWCVNTGGGSQSSNAASGLTVTNNSTLDYPKCVGRWAWPGYDVVTSDFLVEMTGFHPHAKDRKPFACVQFDCTDEHSHSATQQTATEMALSTRGGDALAVSVYAATIPVSAMDQGDVLTCRFRAYPWVGDANSVLDSATTGDGVAAPSEDLTPLMLLCDKSGTYGVTYCYVDQSLNTTGSVTAGTFVDGETITQSGTSATALVVGTVPGAGPLTMLVLTGTPNSSGVWTGGTSAATFAPTGAPVANGANSTSSTYSKTSESAATATSGVNSIANAIQSIKAFNNATYGRNTADAGVIVLKQGYHFGCYTVSGGAGNTKAWTTIRPVTGASHATIRVGSNIAVTGYFKYQGVTFNATSNGVMRGNTSTGQLWLDQCIITSLSSSSAIYAWRAAYATRCAIASMTQGFLPFSTNRGPWALVRGCDNSGTAFGATLYCVVGNDGIGPTFQATGNAAGNAISDNAIAGWNRALAITGLFASQWGASTSITKGLAIIGNLAERITDDTQPFVQLWADNVLTENASNVYMAHNTFAGQRCNLNYLEGGTVNATRNRWFDLYNLFRDFNVKTDTFDNATYDPSANRVGNWAWVNGVGCRGSRYELANFPRDFAGIDVAVVGGGSMGYTDDESVAGGGAGNGDYSLTSGSAARNRIPSGQAVLPFDLNGVPFGNAGDGSAGALQRSGDLITFNPGLQTGFGFFA